VHRLLRMCMFTCSGLGSLVLGHRPGHSNGFPPGPWTKINICTATHNLVIPQGWFCRRTGSLSALLKTISLASGRCGICTSYHCSRIAARVVPQADYQINEASEAAVRLPRILTVFKISENRGTKISENRGAKISENRGAKTKRLA
jgi:hypothetical protein